MILWYIFQHSETTLISKSRGEWFPNLHESVFQLQGPVFSEKKNSLEETSHFCMNIKFHPIQQSISRAVNSLPFVTVSIRTRAYIIISIFPHIDSTWDFKCCEQNTKNYNWVIIKPAPWSTFKFWFKTLPFVSILSLSKSAPKNGLKLLFFWDHNQEMEQPWAVEYVQRGLGLTAADI